MPHNARAPSGGRQPVAGSVLGRPPEVQRLTLAEQTRDCNFGSHRDAASASRPVLPIADLPTMRALRPLLLIALSILLAGCPRPAPQTITVVRVDTVYVASVQFPIDSVITPDTVAVVQRYESRRMRLIEELEQLEAEQAFVPPPFVLQAPTPPAVQLFADGKHAVLTSPLAYAIARTGDQINVPAGFTTDFASIPGWAMALGCHPTGQYATAAVIHDYLYWAGGCTKDEADRLFLIAMYETRVPLIRRTAVYGAVLLGGHDAFDANAASRAKRELRVLPPAVRVPPAVGGWPERQAALMRAGQLQAVPIEPVPRTVCAARAS